LAQAPSLSLTRSGMLAGLLALGLAFAPLAAARAQDAGPQPGAGEAPAPEPAAGQGGEKVWRHAAALVGEPTYPADFKHFNYVNPDAPKGGRVRLSDSGGFDSLNVFLDRGDPAASVALIYDTLMTPSMDEISAEYGLLAEAMSWPDDYSSVSFRLRPEARWHDGQPVTAEDVVWSFEKLVANNATQRFYYKHVTGAEVTGEREVTFTFDETGNRELPNIVGQLMVLPKHWWEGTTENGRPRDIGATTLEPPLGSGPYRIARVDPGRGISYARVDDYWGKDLPVNVGTNNFDELSYEFYLDDTVELEAFKADRYDWRTELTAKNWATGYDIPAVRDGRVVREKFEQPYRRAGVMVGFLPNLRRDKFKDVRVRRALNLALNFEEMNRTLFFGQYARIDSYYYGLPFAAGPGLPEGREKEILESLGDIVPKAVFEERYANPVVATAQDHRKNLREALALLKEAGWELKNNRLVNAAGEPFTFEFLIDQRFERVGLRYQADLRLIGIELTIRVVDSAQYTNRIRSRDFDMIYTGWGESFSPGNEQYDFFGSEAADSDASRNFGGIKDPAVDALIRKVVGAKDRDELEASVAALDRVLLAGNYVIPGWTQRALNVARWDRFAHPDPLPEFSIGFPTVWWWNPDGKANARK